ncbi:MAG: hypothetical protein NVSMB52_11580 [Chloroflexota bacterium]
MCAAGAIAGFLVEASILRRAARARSYLVAFSSLAGAFGGGVAGAASGIALTFAYLAQYGIWPPDIVGQVLYVLAYPCFAAVGAIAGALCGALAGLIAGGVLCIVRVSPR